MIRRIGMESIYYVMTWLCHRTCVHCYEDRFRPYYGNELKAVVAESVANMPRIVDHFPERMTFFDPEEKPGMVILAGGEILLEAVREPVLYAGIERLQAKYKDRGGVRIIVQTTGDLLTPKIAGELKGLGVSKVSISGLDSFHAGLETLEAQQALQQKCARILDEVGQDSHFFGANPDQWIGKLWPRGRAWQNGLSTATLADNFCNQWSGGLNFLETRKKGGEVSVDPQGNVFPCCIKTKAPLGNLLEKPLEEILDSKRGDPVYEAISAGQPERMGLERGWSVEHFIEKSTVGGYQNLCIGCDAFHDEVLENRGLVQLL
jgi:sulfatase maturation enzyme AslB (radical SAM superfamily)